jgi:hypothetical protein
MILPTKTCSLSNSLLGFGRVILKSLATPNTVTALWEKIHSEDQQITFEKFILTLDLLYLLSIIEFDHGLLRRKIND